MNAARRARIFSVGACVGLGLASCSSDDATKQVDQSTTIPIATTTTSSMPESTTSTTTVAQATAKHVADCVQYIPIGAFSGVQQMVDLWTFIAQDAAQLPALCQSLATSDPATLAEISTTYEATLTPAATTQPTAAPTVTSTTIPTTDSTASDPTATTIPIATTTSP